MENPINYSNYLMSSKDNNEERVMHSKSGKFMIKQMKL